QTHAQQRTGHGSGLGHRGGGAGAGATAAGRRSPRLLRGVSGEAEANIYGTVRTHMGKEIINPPGLPEPRGFNHGLLTTGGRMLFLAGQDASDGEGRIVAPGDMLAQCQQVLHNLHAVVHEAGGVMSDIVKLNVYVTSRDAYLAQLKPLGK